MTAPPPSRQDPLHALPLAPGLDWATFDTLLGERAQRLAHDLASGEQRVDRPSLLLRFGDEQVALPLEAVREIRNEGEVRWLPGLPAHIAGVVSRRGRAYAVLDLARYLDLAALRGAEGWLVLLQGANVEVYVQADEAIDVGGIAPRVEPASPTWSARRRAVTQGLLPGLVTLIDPDRLLQQLTTELKGSEGTAPRGSEP